MTPTPALIATADSRLLRQLAEMGLNDAPMAPRKVADSLAQLIDLSDSISLSETLRGLHRCPFNAAEVTPPRQYLLDRRAEMLVFIANSFVSQASSVPFLLPRATADTLGDAEAGFQPYQRFYALHQSEMDQRIGLLRRTLRDSLAGRSPQLAQLAMLDRQLADTLAEHSRRVLAALPRLAARRFALLREDFLATASAVQQADPDNWAQAGGWLAIFHHDMQGLLLAELELRLQPVLGLLEAFEAEDTE